MQVFLHLPTGNAKKVSIPYGAVSFLTNKLSAFCKGNIMEEIFLQHLYICIFKQYSDICLRWISILQNISLHDIKSSITLLHQLDFDS